MTPTEAFLVWICVFIVQQFLDKLSVTPILRHKECIAEIDHLLKFYYNLTTNAFPLEERRESGCIKAMDEIRMASCKLEATHKAIFGRKLFAMLHLIPKHKSVTIASNNLIRLSNMVGTNPMEWLGLDAEIRKLLGIERM